MSWIQSSFSGSRKYFTVVILGIVAGFFSSRQNDWQLVGAFLFVIYIGTPILLWINSGEKGFKSNLKTLALAFIPFAIAAGAVTGIGENLLFSQEEKEQIRLSELAEQEKQKLKKEQQLKLENEEKEAEKQRRIESAKIREKSLQEYDAFGNVEDVFLDFYKNKLRFRKLYAGKRIAVEGTIKYIDEGVGNLDVLIGAQNNLVNDGGQLRPLEDNPYIICPIPATKANQEILLDFSEGDRIAIVGDLVQEDGDINMKGLGYGGVGFKLKDCRILL